jgi:hypothetical protein
MVHNLYSSADNIRQIHSRRMRWAGHVACMAEETEVFKGLMGKPEGKRPLERPRLRRSRMDRRDVGLGRCGVDLLDSG